jgi:hypothetical protein
MGSATDAIVTDAAPAARGYVMVIGSGTVRASIALFLARQGIPVTLCDKVLALDGRTLARLAGSFPGSANVQVLQHWVGLIDAKRNAVPLISRMPPIPGFFIDTGLSGRGFGIGPGRRPTDGRSRDRPRTNRRSGAVPVRALQHGSRARPIAGY